MSGFAIVRGTNHVATLANMCAALSHRGETSKSTQLGVTGIAALNRNAGGHFQADVGHFDGVAVFIEGWITTAAELKRTHRCAGLAEAVAADFRQLGQLSLERLRGAFAVGVVDSGGNRVLLHRSVAGQRPVYYWQQGHSFAAASEMRAVLAHPLYQRQLDQSTLGHVLVTGVEPYDQSLALGIRKLAPGHILEFSAGQAVQTRLLSPVRYAVGDWANAAEAADALRDALDLGVESALQATTGKVGVFLSGGVDSYLVGESLSRLAPGRVQSGTAGVSGSLEDESTAAAIRAARLGIAHVSESWSDGSANESLLELLEGAVVSTEQPSRYENALLLVHLLRRWPDVPRTLFSGDMADVLFGDPYYRALDRTELLQAIVPWYPARRALGGIARRLPTRRTAALSSLLDRKKHDFRLYFGDLLAHEGTQTLLGFDPVPKVQESFDRLVMEARELSRSQRYCYVHLRTSGQGSIDKLERLVAHAGADLVHPFLTEDVFKLGFALPPRLKYRPGVVKIVPRALEARILPPDVHAAIARGFSAPRSSWIQNDRSLQEGVESLRAGGARLRMHVDGDELDRIVDGATGHDGRRYADQAWVLLAAELWCRHFRV